MKTLKKEDLDCIPLKGFDALFIYYRLQQIKYIVLA